MFDSILKSYLFYKDWIDLIQDISFLLGIIVAVVGFISYMVGKSFTDKNQQISDALQRRKDIEKPLSEYVYEQHKNDVYPEVRFVYWKNYPYNLAEDGFRESLYVRSMSQDYLPSGYINKTGLNFVERPWFFNFSAYIDTDGIFFFAESGQMFNSFKEVANCNYIKHLPFSNVVNFDFKEFIEYEPVIYTRYMYHSWKLYDDQIILINRPESKPFRIELSQSRRLQNYSMVAYTFLKIKLWFLGIKKGS